MSTSGYSQTTLRPLQNSSMRPMSSFPWTPWRSGLPQTKQRQRAQLDSRLCVASCWTTWLKCNSGELPSTIWPRHPRRQLQSSVHLLGSASYTGASSRSNIVYPGVLEALQAVSVVSACMLSIFAVCTRSGCSDWASHSATSKTMMKGCPADRKCAQIVCPCKWQ